MRGIVARITKGECELVANRIVPHAPANALVRWRRLFLDFLSRNSLQAGRESSSGNWPSQCASRGLSPPTSTCSSTPGILSRVSGCLDQALRIDQSQRLFGFSGFLSAFRMRPDLRPLGFPFVSLISVHALSPQRRWLRATTASKPRACSLARMDSTHRRNRKQRLSCKPTKQSHRQKYKRRRRTGGRSASKERVT
jgi:hypothetical protein